MRRRPEGGPRWWNFWTRVLGTTYEFTGWHPDDMHLPPAQRRKIRAYGGKTIQRPWTKRIEEHMWGRHYGNEPKPWRDTIPGWRPNGTAQEIIAAGGVRITWQHWTVPLVLSLVEWFYSIKWRRPYYNDIGNHNNRRRIDKTTQKVQAALRRGMVPDEIVSWTSYPRLPAMPRGIVAVIVLTVLGFLFFPGMPGWLAAVWVIGAVSWAVANWQLLAGTVVLGALAMAFASATPKRRRRSTRRRR